MKFQLTSYMLMSNSRFIQSLLWALHNNYVTKYGFKKTF